MYNERVLVVFGHKEVGFTVEFQFTGVVIKFFGIS